MKITPIEIRQKTFEKGFRGYEKEEVNAFLLSLSQEWEKLIDENKEYKIKLEMTEKEVRKLKEVENSLYKTLKTAEDTGTHLIEQASKSADLRLMEAQQKAEIMLTEAQNRARSIIVESDQKAKQALEDVLTELKSLERDFRMMENLRDNMLMELKSMANDTLERVTRMDAKHAQISFDSKIREVRNLIDKRNTTLYEERTPLAPQKEETKPIFLAESTETSLPYESSTPSDDTKSAKESAGETPDTDQSERPLPAEEKKGSGSFFDELEAS